ncbi:GGDEF domain-containing phosphodiesterase [Psychrobacillus sp. OK032]|uniref:GGDEF domain-containing phosphodiesterase n=1 Tax=Psychrobacillus sp. OK032 TaxID=1884358 RepID=UPI0008B8C1CB|nr:GGDEF domain-containing phosphodiesterase [Psychrobacillus sp. OK032]SER61634.1 PAS domain S-box-containing protein/diguanylate cyclase (GGDEF) domain-containing protein [Psychrobacillus sp. OK032]
MDNSVKPKLIMNHYIGDLMDENPLPFIFLERDKENILSVIYVNHAAASFFENTSQEPQHFFSTEVWDQLHVLLNSLEVEKHTLHSSLLISLQNQVFSIGISVFILQSKANILYGLTMHNTKNIIVENHALLEIKEKYLSLLNHNTDSVFLVDERGMIQYTNVVAGKILGYDLDKLLHQPIEQFIESNSLGNFQLMTKQTLSGYPAELQKCLFQHANGHYIYVYLKAIPINDQGNVKEFHLVLRDLTISANDKDQLYYLAYHDHLTGLWNRRALKEHLRDNLIDANNRKGQIAIMRIDLDRFKLINESLGYNYGDDLLKKIADRLSLFINKSSNLYRQSGDEFVFILKDKTREETSSFAENILSELSKPIYLDHQEYFVTASIGISMYPLDGKNLDELLIKADQALFVAKDRGRAHFRYFQEQMNLSFPNEALMESHLRRAIEKEELSIHYQPQVNLATGEINSFEALLRWNNRKFGYVSPMQFIPLAEESGMIMQIGDWVLEEVCKQLEYWQEKGYRPVRIAVNISPKQFKQENFAIKIREKIDKYAITPNSLEVEITESAMTDMQDTFAMLKELKDIGVVISIDDFGTGYSSLSYLKKYPIDIIKIDQSFIKDMELDVKNAAIATTIIQLAHSLGMEVIAEGVEKDQQVEILKSANCQKAQGYFFSRPVPIDDINQSYMTNQP